MILCDDVSRDFLILIVDDDAMIRALANAALTQAGFAVVESESGSEGLENFQRLQPDLVLLDVMMPEMDGFAVCRAIRQLAVGGETPVLMMTGLEDTEAIDEAYEAGATDFITKPIVWTILCHRVRYMLRSSRILHDLRISEARLSNAHRIALMGTWEWDMVHNKFYWSKELYGIFRVDPLGFDSTYQAFLNSIHPLDKELVNKSIEDACTRKQPLSVDHLILLPNGEERFCHTEGEVFFDAKDRATRIAGTIQDITERRRIEEQVRSLAYFDNVTGLPNRVLFREHLDRALSFAARYKKKVAILFLDLDRFKEVNDTLGHATGDDLLRGIADRLKQSVRGYDLVSHDNQELKKTDPDSIARLGGDEFTIILENIDDSNDILQVINRILKAVAEPFFLNGNEICVTASIGISLFPDDGTEAGSLVKNADTAMYHAKKEGRNNSQFFKQALNDAVLERTVLERRLRKALANEEFLLHYQPQVDASRGQVVGLEALIRWQSPEMGLVTPVSFIPFAEETGQIMLIDEWVVGAVCRQVRRWLDQGVNPPRVAVNLSGHHFLRKNLVPMVADSLHKAGIGGERLELELTEGVIMRNVEEAVNSLRELQAMGVTISIDDFGTGYSSLSYLKRFPIDTLKIDRSFVHEVSQDNDSATITSAIISMAKSLRLGIIAEGVETLEQMIFLQQNGCSIMQGYFFSRPLPPSDVVPLIATGIHRSA